MRILGLLGCLAAACSGPGGPVVIGVAGPFSQARGVSMRHAAQLAADEINTRGGIGGRPLELVFADDSGRDSLAVVVAQRLRNDPRVVAVVGHLTSGTSIAAGRVYGSGVDPVVMISPSASSPDLSGINPYVFRVCPSDLTHGPQLARFVRQRLGAARAGVIYINNDYGRGVRRTFVAEFVRLGGTIVSEDPYLPATTSLEPYLTRLGGSDPEVLVLATERAGAELALREMAQLGLRWPVVGGDALTGIEAASGGALAEGVRVSSAYLADRPGERNAAFVEAYAQAFAGQRPDHRGAGAYDILHLLARVLAESGTARRSIREHLARMPAFEGVTGRIDFNDQGDVPDKPVVIGVVRAGRLVTEAAQ